MQMLKAFTFQTKITVRIVLEKNAVDFYTIP